MTIVPQIFSVCIVLEQGASDTVILSSWSCVFNCLLTAQHGQGVRSQPRFDFSVMTRLSPLCVVFPLSIFSQYQALARKLIFFYLLVLVLFFLLNLKFTSNDFGVSKFLTMLLSDSHRKKDLILCAI